MSFKASWGSYVMQPTDTYSKKIRDAALAEFGDDGAWLLLSIDRYGWRAFYDLGTLVAASAPRITGEFHSHAQIVADLQIQANIYAVTEQLCRLLLATLSHVKATEEFFKTYCAYYANIDLLLTKAQQVERKQLGELMGEPASEKEVIRTAEQHGVPLAPEDAPEVLGGVRKMMDQFHLNLQELGTLTAPPPLESPVGDIKSAHSLRAVDNSFRHGLRLLFHDALPGPRGIQPVNEEAQQASPYAVDLHLKEQQPRFGSIICSPDRTRAHFDVLGLLGLRVKQLAGSFLWGKAMESSLGILAAAERTVSPLLPVPD
jgi:hypothetical protein